MKTLAGFLAATTCLALSTSLSAGEGKLHKEDLKARIKQFDVDGDGKLSADEKATMRAAVGERRPNKPGAEGEGKAGLQQKIIEKFDVNGNGKLDPDERAVAQKAAAEHRKKKGKADPNQGDGGFPPPGGNGGNGLNGQPGGGGVAGPQGDGRAKLLEKFDLNRDGQLSTDEMARAKQMMERRGGGQGGLNLPPGVARPVPGKLGRAPRQ